MIILLTKVLKLSSLESQDHHIFEIQHLGE
jgi:hypothetical protein